MLKILILVVFGLHTVLACNSADERRSKAVQEISDHSTEDEADIEDDSTEAFEDVEEESILCQGYTPEPTKQELPTAVVFGTRKGGTRALLEFLNMHSLVRRAKSEVHFYDKFYEKGVDWYISQMPPIQEGQIAMEKTPGYFHTAVVPERIFQTKNDTKLLMIIRDPVKRLISDYNQFYYNNMKKGVDYPSLESFLFTADGEIDVNYPPLQRSLYHIHFERWLKFFNMSQIYIVDGDSFIKEPWVEMSNIEDFLELPHEVGQDNFYFNQTKGFYCGKEIISNVNSQWTCTRNKCLSKSKGRKPPALADDIMARLYDFMEPYNQKFFQLINRFDFAWNRNNRKR